MKNEPIQATPSWGNDKWSDPDVGHQIGNCQERLVRPLLVIPKDAADPSRIEKLEKAGYIIVVTDHPEKVLVIEKATTPPLRNEKQQYRNRFHPETHPCNPNRGYIPPQRTNEMLVPSEGNETGSMDS